MLHFIVFLKEIQGHPNVNAYAQGMMKMEYFLWTINIVICTHIRHELNKIINEYNRDFYRDDRLRKSNRYEKATTRKITKILKIKDLTKA